MDYTIIVVYKNRPFLISGSSKSDLVYTYFSAGPVKLVKEFVWLVVGMNLTFI